MSLYHKNEKTQDQEKTSPLNESFFQDVAATSAEQAHVRPRALKLPYIPCLINKILSPHKNRGKELKAVEHG